MGNTLKDSTFSVIITTHNRLAELKLTLEKMQGWTQHSSIQWLICDDGSDDGTSDFIQENYPDFKLIRNERTKGLIYSRNRLMNLCETEFAISLDDDLHLIGSDILGKIHNFFSEHPKVAVLSFRIFWSTEDPERTQTRLQPEQVNSFAGGAHVWRMAAWKEINGYPDWFIFYGEERHAAMQLFKAGWSCYYFPQILAHHRVNLGLRKKQRDYVLRLRRSIRSGWYLYFLFFPWAKIPRRLVYTIWQQLKSKVFKGDFKALNALFLASTDLLIKLPKLLRDRTPFSMEEWIEFNTLNPVKLYWNPDEET